MILTFIKVRKDDCNLYIYPANEATNISFINQMQQWEVKLVWLLRGWSKFRYIHTIFPRSRSMCHASRTVSNNHLGKCLVGTQFIWRMDRLKKVHDNMVTVQDQIDLNLTLPPEVWSNYFRWPFIIQSYDIWTAILLAKPINGHVGR